MKIAVVGTGYVGLVTGTCFADSGNEVICIDKDAGKIARLQGGVIPIYEPGLEEMVRRNFQNGRLTFTTNLVEGVEESQWVFIAVGTPQSESGAADLTTVFEVAKAIARSANGKKIVVIKSTVPVGTNKKVQALVDEHSAHPILVASNPEFLKEGAAIEDCTKPDRVVIGIRSLELADSFHELYAPFLRTEHPLLVMSPESAEMTKYAANAMLATKISYINEMANLCEKVGGDINDVRRGIGHDARIGFQFLFPGAGYGGSCFPKDIRALIHMARENGEAPAMLEAIDAVNEKQKQVLFNKISGHFHGKLQGLRLALWGLAFKPRTDDIREASALALIDALLKAGVSLKVHDPQAMENTRAIHGNKMVYCESPYEALEGADALAIVTEWQEFRNPDFKRMGELLKNKIIFDGRNLYDPKSLKAQGFTYYSIGRKTVCPEK
ncbi:MAG: UDP-glucose/GDP-mannose dehydrogenase family protein [Gemmataceae bacterium]|nr:UDP-glucose/GDP-mannose dehydrogenase family protein [Gemmataceae bacterium]